MYTLTGLLARVVLWGIVVVSAWTVVRDWSMLIEHGGLFAVFGQFLAVVCTLSLAVMLILLGLGLLFLPVLVYYAVAEPQLIEERTLSQWTLKAANPVWKVLWWILIWNHFSIE